MGLPTTEACIEDAEQKLGRKLPGPLPARLLREHEPVVAVEWGP